jgi:hypothetical protein
LRAVRVFSSRLGRRERRIYGGVLLYFLIVFAAMLWPIYPLFSRARPLVAGLPLALFYLVVLLIASFGVLLGLYGWEKRRGRLDPESDS